MSEARRSRRSTRPRLGGVPLLPLAGVAALAAFGIVLSMPASTFKRRTDPTFAKDVAPIFYKNCTTCHRPGGQGPFSLLDYDSAAKHLDEISDAVGAGVMPPWHAEGP